jgi:hypothetical protein
MATKTASKAAAGIQPKGLSVGLVAVTSTWSLTSSNSAGDVIQMIKVPKGATPVYVSLTGAGTGVGSVNVGDGVSAARYISNYLNSAASAMTVINTNYTPYTYSVDDTIDITVSAVSLATVAGSFVMTAIFAMDT